VGDEAAGWREGCLRTAAVRAALSIISVWRLIILMDMNLSINGHCAAAVMILNHENTTQLNQ